jgi:hypothetical protein
MALGRGEELNQREGERGISTQSWVKNIIQSINSDKHLPQSPFTGLFFSMTMVSK